MKLLVLMGLLLSHCLCSSGQDFEAASIKPSPEIDSSKGPVHFGSRGGPGTESAGRYWCDFCEVSDLIAVAYEVPEYRIASTRRLPRDRFDVVATIAPGTTRDQFRLMLQNLLVGRFGLKIHRDNREIRAYRLLTARGGAKLKPYVEGSLAESRSSGGKAQLGHYYRTQATLKDFAKVIENTLHKPVVDGTGLPGKYDFDLSWSDGDLEAGEQSHSDLPTLSSAIRSLGLELESHKEQVDVMVVDDIAKSPIEN